MASHIDEPRLVARVEFILKRQVEIASQEYYRAKFESWQLSVMPGGASEQQRSEAARKCAVKENVLTLAQKRLHDFVRRGTIPEDG